MKYNNLKWLGFLLIVAFSFMSCAGTEITQKYADEAFTGKMSNFLIIGLIGSPHHQRNFEKEFASQLKSIGVDAVSSEAVMTMPSDLALTKEMILNAVQKHKNDAVIITRLVGKEHKETNHIVQYGSDYYEYYVNGYMYVNGRITSSSKTTVYLETNLFDVKTEKLIWSGISKTLSRDPEDGEVSKEVVSELVKRIQNSRLISH